MWNWFLNLYFSYGVLLGFATFLCCCFVLWKLFISCVFGHLVLITGKHKYCPKFLEADMTKKKSVAVSQYPDVSVSLSNSLWTCITSTALNDLYWWLSVSVISHVFDYLLGLAKYRWHAVPYCILLISITFFFYVLKDVFPAK